MTKKKKQSIDLVLLTISLILVIFGLVMVAIVSTPLSLEQFGNTWHYLRHQFLFGILPGIVACLILFKLPLSLIKKWTVPVLILNILAMILVFIPGIGVSTGGASRWLNLGFFSIQPSEFLKLSFLLYLSLWLSKRIGEKEKRTQNINQTLIAFILILGIISFLLIKQPDMGTLIVISLVSGLVYFANPIPIWHIASVIFTFLGGFALMIILAPYRIQRILTFLNPGAEPLRAGYQIHQSLIALGSGRLFGVDTPFGLATQKFGFLPHSMSDSIFAIIGEELGLLGCLSLIFLFLLFFWRGIRIALASSDRFLFLLSLGISGWFIIQTFLNISAITGLAPLTGIPLPFISYGGSHIIAELMALGILLNISRENKYI
jgi:cell division protein FtsW